MNRIARQALVAVFVVPRLQQKEPPKTPEGDKYQWTCGREYEVDQELQYNRARHFDPAPGQWIAAVPFGQTTVTTIFFRIRNRSICRTVIICQHEDHHG